MANNEFEEIIKENIVNIVFVLLALALAYTIGFGMGSGNQQVRTIIVENNSIQNIQARPAQRISLEALENVSIILPGVNREGSGVAAKLLVQRRDGSGRVFLNFDESNPIIANETQASLKNAVRIARTFSTNTATSFSTSDLFYSFNSNSIEIGGSSAGTAMAIATIALLEGKALNNSIAITGKLAEDGHIERVGGVLEKAKALKAAGVTKFLVPVGEATQETGVVNETQQCTEQPIGGGSLTNCRSQTSVDMRVVSIANETGMIVVEVQDVYTAYAEMVNR